MEKINTQEDYFKYSSLTHNIKNMQQKTEKLEQSLVDKLKSLNTKIGELSLEIGRLHLKKVEIDSAIKEIEKNYIELSNELSIELIELDKKYPNGEVDLIEGTVTF